MTDGCSLRELTPCDGWLLSRASHSMSSLRMHLYSSSLRARSARQSRKEKTPRTGVFNEQKFGLAQELTEAVT
ncbi:MAG: hypothetical protein RLY40_583 [Pseudomonadota bacterium]|jgi:hypothetical protein